MEIINCKNTLIFAKFYMIIYTVSKKNTKMFKNITKKLLRENY